MHKAPEIARFVRTHLRTALPEFTGQYKQRDILRMRGHVAQWVFVGTSRSGWIDISPTLSVLGSKIYEKDLESNRCRDGSIDTNSLISTVAALKSTSATALRRWQFRPETLLDEAFAAEILIRLKQDSPISFTQPLEDEAIDKALRWFGKDGYWLAHLFLAFFNMTRGAPTARKDLAQAFDLFRRNSRLSTDKPLHDWEEALLARFRELESRLDRTDCIALCRADAEEHARLLKLPPIVWPPEWPESMLPWPTEPDSLASWVGRLFRKP